MRCNSSRFHSSSRRSLCLLDLAARASTRLGNPGERQNCARDRPCARQCAIRPRAAASPGRRDLPIRGSPETRNIRPPPRLAFSIAALSSSSSRLRPTNRAELELGGGFVFHRHDSSPLRLLVREKCNLKRNSPELMRNPGGHRNAQLALRHCNYPSEGSGTARHSERDCRRSKGGFVDAHRL